MGLSACALTAPEPPRVDEPKVEASLASMYAPIKDGELPPVSTGQSA